MANSKLMFDHSDCVQPFKLKLNNKFEMVSMDGSGDFYNKNEKRAGKLIIWCQKVKALDGSLVDFNSTFWETPKINHNLTLVVRNLVYRFINSK